MEEVFGLYEVAITGPEADKMRIEIEKNYIPNKIILGGNEGSLPLLENRIDQTTRIFICKDRTCRLPVGNIADALKQIND
jgi:uncharacterized protein YyaL (SSP411 family)